MYYQRHRFLTGIQTPLGQTIKQKTMKAQTFKSSFFALVALTGLVSLAGCFCDLKKLSKTSWVLEQYGPLASPKDVFPPSMMTPPGKAAILLEFRDENHINGTDGCNQYGGIYKSNGRCKIRFDSIMTTLMMCRDTVMLQAGAYNSILGDVESFKVTNQQLKLFTLDRRMLKFKKK